jgi:2-polyprenyl-3-methyl-5-hydroxy-6-metoxy-1,4-benzoquinol methylase
MHLLRKIFRRVEVTILYFLGKIRAVYSESKYEIKRGYIHRTRSLYFDDTPLKDEYQKEVYELARFYLDKYGYKNVLDIGCGSGYKLLQFFHDCNTVGTDISPTYEFLTTTYPDRIWVNALQIEKYPAATDMVICADVIEHIVNPDELLTLIRKIDFRILFISTPERSMVRGWYDYGPPENICHVREWNAKEFRRYIAKHFQIVSHQITNVEDATQLLICIK